MSDQTGNDAVLITGTSTGIGRATALHLDRLGYHVFATVRKDEDGERLCEEASARLIPLLMDVTDQESIEHTRYTVERALGERGLSGLVNKAGIGISGPLEFFPLEWMRRLYEVNLFGQLAVTQAFLPMLRQACGRIVNISSTATLVVAPFHGPYTSPKLALNGLTNALRLELKPHGVQVCLVICGSVNTLIWERGGQLSQQAAQSFPPQVKELYGPQYSRLVEFFTDMGDNGVTPEVAAQQIARALTARRPRNTYFIGPDAHLFNILDKLLYGKLRDWAILRVIGINE
jgi:NAD(P)-dependent dehydrogenase (short-subunit alcohol dehydrogenase family)